MMFRFHRYFQQLNQRTCSVYIFPGIINSGNPLSTGYVLVLSGQFRFLYPVQTKHLLTDGYRNHLDLDCISLVDLEKPIWCNN